MPEDLFRSFIAGMDTFAIGWKIARKIIKDGAIDKIIKERYKGYNIGIGKKIVDGDMDFEGLESYIIDKSQILNQPGLQEYMESVLNQYILNFYGK